MLLFARNSSHTTKTVPPVYSLCISVLIVCLLICLSLCYAQFPPRSGLDVNEKILEPEMKTSTLSASSVSFGISRWWGHKDLISSCVIFLKTQFCVFNFLDFTLRPVSRLSLRGFQNLASHQGPLLILRCFFVLNMKSKYYSRSPSVILHYDCNVLFPVLHNQPMTCSFVSYREVWFVGTETKVLWKTETLDKKVSARHTESRPLWERKKRVVK